MTLKEYSTARNVGPEAVVKAAMAAGIESPSPETVITDAQVAAMDATLGRKEPQPAPPKPVEPPPSPKVETGPDGEELNEEKPDPHQPLDPFPQGDEGDPVPVPRRLNIERLLKGERSTPEPRKPFLVSAVGGGKKTAQVAPAVCYSWDESGAIGNFVQARGIANAAAYNFRATNLQTLTKGIVRSLGVDLEMVEVVDDREGKILVPKRRQ